MSWIEDLRGYVAIEGQTGVAATSRKIVRFVGATVTDDGTRTLVTIPQTPLSLSGFSLAAKADTGTGTAQSLTLGTNQLPLRAAGNVVATTINSAEFVGRTAGGSLGSVGATAAATMIGATAFAAGVGATALTNQLVGATAGQPGKVDLAAAYAWTAAQTFATNIFATGSTAINLAATANDLAIGAVTRVRITSTGARTLTGMVQGDGHLVFLHNNDDADILTLAHDNAGSTSQNRFRLANSADVSVRPRGAVVCMYDVGLGRWAVSAI